MLPLHDYFMIQIAVLLTFKHYLCDFIFQDSEMAMKKGIYGGSAGIKHALHHAIGTFMVTVFFISPVLSGILAVLDFLIHYHIDWFKMRFGPRSYKDKHYWVWFGTDQFLHHLTYIFFIILIVINGGVT